MKEITVKAVVENLERVTAFVEEQLEKCDCPIRAQMQINVAIDELFSNISYYAYGQGEGDATIRFEIDEEPLSVIISFIDSGVPYNPLEKEDPNVSESIEKREIGGLGIFIVKKSMDAVEYEYKDGKNILKIKKNI